MIGAALRTLVRRPSIQRRVASRFPLAQVADVTLASEPSVISAAISFVQSQFGAEIYRTPRKRSWITSHLGSPQLNYLQAVP